MAASRSPTRSSNRSYRMHALIWLMMTLLLGVATALIWMVSQTPAIGAKIENAPLSTQNSNIDEFEKPLSIEALHELDEAVEPISFEDTIRDLRDYPDEFKDKRYLLANKGKWTVQVMNVAENQVIVSYLEGRADRDKFAYFRYRDDNDQPRYMLTYGLMSSPQEAIGAGKLTDFKLPANVRVIPEEISRYVTIVDNYERPEPIKDLSSRRARSVNLQPTRREVPVNRPETNETDSTDASSADSQSPSTSNSGNDQTESSIRQSEDTDATLSVNEARRAVTEDGRVIQDDSQSQSSQSSNLPVVPTPTPPSSSGNNNNSNNNEANSTNTAQGGDSRSNNSASQPDNTSSAPKKKTQNNAPAASEPPPPANQRNNAGSSNNQSSSAQSSNNQSSTENNASGDSMKSLIEEKSE